MKYFLRNLFSAGPFLFFLFISSLTSYAQDERSQLPKILYNSYFEVNVGSINYPFSSLQLEEGYTLQSLEIPHTAVRIIPAGYEINKYLSVQITYMRPVLWVRYKFNTALSDAIYDRSVWMNIAGLTIKPMLPINEKFSVYGEAGLAIITRSGFDDDNNEPIITDANYSTYQIGGGIKYHLNANWGLMLSMIYSPEKISVKQPQTSFYSAGFSYKLLPYSEEKLKESTSTGYFWNKHLFQVGLTSNILGYGVNNFFSEGKVPVFWAGEAELSSGLSLNYQRNIFHGVRIFSLDWGASISFWKSNINKEKFYTLSIYPVLKWTLIRTKPMDIYCFYTLAGPTYISKTILDNKELGRHFTFQDNMGMGLFFGEERNYNIEMKIGHFSNGDLFPSNEGVKVPLSLNLGYSF